jgi:hypothetical protein
MRRACLRGLAESMGWDWSEELQERSSVTHFREELVDV